MKIKPSICFVAHNAYGAISGSNSGHIGGAERQTTLMARWLASKGYEIYLLTWDEGQPSEMTISGVRVLKMCAQDSGIPIIRFFYPRAISLCIAMKRANADIYYHNSAEYVTGIIAAWCRFNNKRFIYSVASDIDCEKNLPAMHKLYEKVLYKYGLTRADSVIVQTAFQKQLLKTDFNLNSVRLPMPCPAPFTNECKHFEPGKEVRLLWVGRVDYMKRLELYLDAAELLPDITFDIAAAYTNVTPYVQKLFTRAENLRNVIWYRNVPRKELSKLYANSSSLCCTSLYEGFPNTFLEAWSHGRPVISTFDPDGLIDSLNLGVAVKNITELIDAIHSITLDPGQWQEKCNNSKIYYENEHSVDKAMAHFESQFLRLVEVA